MEKKQKFFDKNSNRLMVTLLVTVAFPTICGVFYPIFAFLILPITPLLSVDATKSLPWLHIYWLNAAGSWLVLLGIILPQMRKEIKVEQPLLEEKPADINLKKLTSRGSRDVLEETEKELLNRKSSYGYDTKDERASPIKETNRSRLSSVEIAATVHQDNRDNTTKEEHLKKSEEKNHQPIDIEKRRKEFQMSSEDDYIKSLETNDAINDELNAETVVAKSSYSQRVQTFTISEETYECSLPSPTVVSPDDKERNAVFLFVNNDKD